uniref:Glypican-6-like n=1 Tax=Phallusia mammillata TaxID=59560 RepID=A0A6F9DEN7_9ASCI|nr:glypican-6-like [Phallusia mammillata]
MVLNCISRTMHFTTRLVLVGLSLAAIATALKTNRRGLRATDPCTETRRALQLSGLKQPIPHTAVNGQALQMCPREYSCCTNEVEANLITQSNLDFEIQVERKCSLVEHMFSNKSAKVDDFFQKLVDNAKNSLDGLFFRTYGSLYVDNSAIFMNLFDNLKSYYHGETMLMEEIFDNFFTSLLQKVFKLMNSNYIIDDEYMQCIGDKSNTDGLQPFKGMPRQLSMRVHRAFITARSFIRGLEVGKELAFKVAKFDPTHECTKAFMKMSYCSKCQGITSIKPCHGLCLNIMKGCLHDYNTLNSVWNEYIDAMQLILDRLEGHHNIESVLDPFAIRISEAIMTLQDSKLRLQTTIFALCGTPPKANTSDSGGEFLMPFGNLGGMESFALPPSYEWPSNGNGETPSPADLENYLAKLPGSVKRGEGTVEFDLTASREKRSMDERDDTDRKSTRRARRGRRRHKQRLRESDFTDYSMTNVDPYTSSQPNPDLYEYGDTDKTSDPSDDTSLKSLVTEMREMLRATKDHWTNLPTAVCNDVAAATDSRSCWNGESEGTYDSPSVEERSENPEIIGHIPDQVIKAQTIAMRDIIGQLKNVYVGRDPFPSDDESYESSGDYSGSGEGSADGPDEKSDVVKPLYNDPQCPTCGGTNLSTTWSLMALTVIACWLLQK